MSATDTLLVFVDRRNEYEGWLHVGDGGVEGRGAELEGLPALADPVSGRALRTVLVVPGDAVSTHWLEVPAGLAPAQAIAAARLIASEVSAQPLADMHVAVGREQDGEVLRVVAIAPALAMAEWIGKAQARGIDPDMILPEPLLLVPPVDGFVRFDRGGLPLFRGAAVAFAIEPELAEAVLAGAPVAAIDDAAFEAGLGEALAAAPVNLRQGAFAKRRRWTIDWKTVRRLAMLAAAILLVSLAIQVVTIMRYTFAADALELETGRIAAAALPGSSPVGDGAAALERRLAELRGSGVGYGIMTSALFNAVRATPNVQLSRLAFDRDGALRATIGGDAAAVAALGARIEAGGLSVETLPAGVAGGQPTSEIVMRAR